MVAGQYFAVKLIRYVFGLWLPLLLVASHGGLQTASLIQVGQLAAFFDIGSILGSLVFGAQAENLGKRALPLLVFVSTMSLALLLPIVPYVTAYPVDGVSTMLQPTTLMLLAIGLATGGAETLLGSICPIHYAQRSGASVASAVASVNGYGSLGTVASAVVLPLVAGSGGAQDLAHGFANMAPLAGLAALAAASQVQAEWQGQCNAKEA